MNLNHLIFTRIKGAWHFTYGLYRSRGYADRTECFLEAGLYISRRMGVS